MNSNNDSFLVEGKFAVVLSPKQLKMFLYRSLFKTAVSVLFETPSYNAEAIYQPNTLHNINRKCFYPPNTFYHLWQSFIYSDRKVQGMILSYRNLHKTLAQPQRQHNLNTAVGLDTKLTVQTPPYQTNATVALKSFRLTFIDTTK